MKYSVILFTALGLASLSAAVPEYHPYYTDPMFGNYDGGNWDWCAPKVTCHDDADCYTSDCLQKAKGHSGMITCGTWPWWPHSCWTWIPDNAPAIVPQIDLGPAKSDGNQ
ncbi:hypothetical protein AJ78_07056 [Emergomyces pasteurianus Ep9510]|uniref:Endo-1,3(4)-beta-glucanase 1 carbohydrate binding domain-containing protein n=1 Tax=Emergomyces pasteurianus Ep9510 TaxID=1447872 RepID=A0A1J9Q8R4_9EURO|nr:hypothetical protein AJ78_07056 [Emergomyces pasteurianus Ep9510]